MIKEYERAKDDLLRELEAFQLAVFHHVQTERDLAKKIKLNSLRFHAAALELRIRGEIHD